MKQLLLGITALGFATAIAAQVSIIEPTAIKKGSDTNTTKGIESAVVSSRSHM